MHKLSLNAHVYGTNLVIFCNPNNEDEHLVFNDEGVFIDNEEGKTSLDVVEVSDIFFKWSEESHEGGNSNASAS